MRRFALVIALALALPSPAYALSAEGLRARLGREVRFSGGHTGAYVVDMGTGRVLFARGEDVARPPASVEKLYTTSTALLRLGPDATLPTEVLATAAPDADGVLRGDLWLRGGGDPTLSGAGIDALADQVVRAGVVSVHGSVFGDGTAFDLLPGSFRTGGRYDRDMGGALAGLLIDRGLNRGRPQASPALIAARALAHSLRAAEVPVAGRTGVEPAPAGARVLGTTTSPPLSTLVAMTNTPSDNFYAESLAKVLGQRFAGAGTTTAGVGVVRAQLATLGIHPRLADGSGLARANRTTPRQVVRLLLRMAGTRVAPVFRASLPVAGRTGTLRRRMRGTRAAGNCTAKTGTIAAVSALAGYCTTHNGHTVVFALMTSGASTFYAKKREDRMAVALANADV